MQLDVEWSVLWRRAKDGYTCEVEAIGRDFDDRGGFLKIGGHEPEEWTLREAWWLWFRLPAALIVASWAYVWHPVRDRWRAARARRRS